MLMFFWYTSRISSILITMNAKIQCLWIHPRHIKRCRGLILCFPHGHNPRSEKLSMKYAEINQHLQLHSSTYNLIEREITTLNATTVQTSSELLDLLHLALYINKSRSRLAQTDYTLFFTYVLQLQEDEGNNCTPQILEGTPIFPECNQVMQRLELAMYLSVTCAWVQVASGRCQW